MNTMDAVSAGPAATESTRYPRASVHASSLAWSDPGPVQVAVTDPASKLKVSVAGTPRVVGGTGAGVVKGGACGPAVVVPGAGTTGPIGFGETRYGALRGSDGVGRGEPDTTGEPAGEAAGNDRSEAVRPAPAGTGGGVGQNVKAATSPITAITNSAATGRHRRPTRWVVDSSPTSTILT